jgi:hypothetical protein
MSELPKEITREQWDAMTREEQIEFVAAALLAADRPWTKIPSWADWATADIVQPAMKIELARRKAELEQARAELEQALSVAKPEGRA